MVLANAVLMFHWWKE